MSGKVDKKITDSEMNWIKVEWIRLDRIEELKREAVLGVAGLVSGVAVDWGQRGKGGAVDRTRRRVS